MKGNVMCGKMIFPHIERNLRVLSGYPNTLAFEDDLTITEIFAARLENLERGIDLLRELTTGSSGEISPETTIFELKIMIMESSKAHLQSWGFPKERVAAAFQEL